GPSQSNNPQSLKPGFGVYDRCLVIHQSARNEQLLSSRANRTLHICLRDWPFFNGSLPRTKHTASRSHYDPYLLHRCRNAESFRRAACRGSIRRPPCPHRIGGVDCGHCRRQLRVFLRNVDLDVSTVRTPETTSVVMGFSSSILPRTIVQGNGGHLTPR